MAKSTENPVLDAACAKVATATTVTVCSAQPANLAGIAAVALAEATVTPGDGNSFTIGDGDVSGRKVAQDQQADVTIDSSGTATHVARDDGSILLDVTTCTSQVLTAGGTVTIPTYDSEFEDPT